MNSPLAAPLSSASCALHPEAPASASCRRCGDYVCSACLVHDGLCTRCDERLTVLPWQQRSELGFFAALLATLKLSAVEPRRYGRAVAQARGAFDALIFGSLCALVNIALVMLMTSPFMWLGMMAAQKQETSNGSPSPYVVLPIALVVLSILTLIGFVIGSYFWALVLRVSSAISGLSANVKQLWCVVLYAAGPLVLAWVPLAGLLAPAYGVVLTILGVHEATASKSLLRSSLAVLMPLGLILIVGGSAYLAILYFALTRVPPAT